jgi:hypothetical protein
MRPHEIFAAMSPEHAEKFFAQLAEKSPAMFAQSVHAAATALKSRPQYLMKQPMTKRVAAVRRVMSRVSSAAVAEEMLAVYFLECRVEVLTEWLDVVGLAHEDGMLEEAKPPAPDDDTLRQHVGQYRAVDDDPDRELLLQAFAAQQSIDWPVLDELLREALEARS